MLISCSATIHHSCPTTYKFHKKVEDKNGGMNSSNLLKPLFKLLYKMKFSIHQSIEILERTPVVLQNLLEGLSAEWTSNNEGGKTWSAYDVIGHLIHGDKTDWLARAELILSENVEKKFQPFDRFAQFENSKGKTLKQLLDEFKEIRNANIKRLISLNITERNLEIIGVHPTFGEVTLSQLLSTWIVHDLDHISQIVRVMAKQYKNEVGPWIEFLKILKQ